MVKKYEEEKREGVSAGSTWNDCRSAGVEDGAGVWGPPRVVGTDDGRGADGGGAWGPRRGDREVDD